MRAQQAVAVELAERAGRVLGGGGLPDGAGGGDRVGPQRRLDRGLVVGLDERDLVGRRPQHREHVVGVAVAERGRERLDVLLGAEVLGERGDRGVRAPS